MGSWFWMIDTWRLMDILMLNKRGQFFPKFESLVFLGIIESNKLWSDLLNFDFIRLPSIDPCFFIRNKLEWDNKWLGWFKVVFKIVAGSQSESYDSTISRSVGFISSYKLFLKNIKSQKYIRLRQFSKWWFFKRFFREIGVRKFRRGSCFGDSTLFSNSKLRNCCVTLLKHLMKKEKIRNWRNKRFGFN